MCHFKILKSELPSMAHWLHGNHHCLLPKGLHGSGMKGNQLYCTLTPLPHPTPKFLQCHTSVMFSFGILPCLCGSAHAQKVPLWPALQQPPISTYKIPCAHIVWHSYPSSHTYTYSLEDISFGIWLLQGRNI